MERKVKINDNGNEIIGGKLKKKNGSGEMVKQKKRIEKMEDKCQHNKTGKRIRERLVGRFPFCQGLCSL